ncbi:MAG: endonuclease/exonuclease/phosphatase family protein [Desulfovibrionales bacterium]
MTEDQIRVSTYNVHQWVGMDGKYDPDRGLDVLKEIDSHIIALQEVNFPKHLKHRLTSDRMARELEMEIIAGTTMVRKEASYGNVVLTRCEILAVRRHDITVGRYEPRGVIDLDLKLGKKEIRVVSTHLGLRMRERRLQHTKLREILASKPSELLVLMGDFNEWIPLAFPFRRVSHIFHHIHAPKTFPTVLPFLALDRIMVAPKEQLLSLGVHRTPLSRKASDHYPVTAAISL